jgi:ABC-type transport system involved in Fe-S cluster assembly fused permease/ATPase subunit
MPQKANEFDKKIVRKLKAAQIQHRIIGAIETTFDTVVAEEGLVLNRVERARLLTQAARTILEDMLKKLAARKSAKN